MKSISAKQEELLNYVKSFQSEKGMSPTIKEMAAHFEVANNTIVCKVKSLIKWGRLTKEPKVRRGIKVVD